jgi:4-hydroxy-tetrahydrodipicolinate synthase
VDFVIAAGAHGIVTPVNTSEFYLLSDEERERLAEVVVEQARGRVPVVIGVAAPNAGTAAALTRHAREVGAAGVIAMPPSVVALDHDGVRDYYRRIARAAHDLPVVVQNVGGQVGAPLRAELIAQLAAEMPNVRYVKEELIPSTHQIAEVLRVAGDHLTGVFGGSGGRYLVDELKRGACGLMSGCHLVDAQVRVYDLLRSGDEAGARAAFYRQLPAQNLWSLLGLGLAKEILRRRGVFRTTLSRRPDVPLDAADHAELDAVLGLVAPDLIPFASGR